MVFGVVRSGSRVGGDTAPHGRGVSSASGVMLAKGEPLSSLFDIAGKVVVLTGASYGLGEVMANALADAGATLVLAARSAELLQGVADSCSNKGAEVTAVVADISREDDVSRIVATTIEAYGRIDVLVNNAGVSDLRGLPAESFDLETFRRIVDVDLTGAYLLARDIGRHMLSAGQGSIVNICSIMASGANELNVVGYTAAKGGLLNLTYQLGCEWADRGVRVNAISPGFVVTPMTAPGLDGLGVADYVASRTPMRLGVPARCGHGRRALSRTGARARAVRFLADRHPRHPQPGTGAGVGRGRHLSHGPARHNRPPSELRRPSGRQRCLNEDRGGEARWPHRPERCR
jgi:NAD(P)-dependent dehydrogenase (short-subunit alcohol dehydrogenase family)